MIRIAQFRPRVEVPEFTRCCFCLPLRHGLLVWGYFKMVSLLMFAFILVEDLIRITKYAYSVPTMMVLFLCLLLIDLIFNTMFIVAGHMKHQKLFKMYYYYSIVFLATFVSGYVIVLGTYFYAFRNFSSYMLLWLTLDTLYIVVPIILVQIYLTLLVRSEARKLDNSSNFQFVNTTAEASESVGLNNIENDAAVTQ